MHEEMDETIWVSTFPKSVEKYVDDEGVEREEEVQTMPPPNFVDKGPSFYNSGKLDLHTTGQIVAKKGNELESVMGSFDLNSHRAVESFSQTASKRLSVQVDLNKRGVQPAPDIEYGERSELYKGYNIRDPNISRKIFIPDTRRGVQPLSVTGNERRAGFDKRREDGDVRDPFKVGSVRSEALESGKLEGNVPLRRGEHKLGGQVYEELPIYASRGGDFTSASSIHPSGRQSMKADPIHADVRKGLAFEERALDLEVDIGNKDSTKATDSNRKGGVLDAGKVISNVAGGRSDSTRRRDPNKVTFTELSAAVSSMFIGNSDSTLLEGGKWVNSHYESAPVAPLLQAPNKVAEPSFLKNRKEESEMATLVKAARSRDSKNDSSSIERVVVEMMNNQALVASQRARDSKVDSNPSLPQRVNQMGDMSTAIPTHSLSSFDSTQSQSHEIGKRSLQEERAVVSHPSKQSSDRKMYASKPGPITSYLENFKLKNFGTEKSLKDDSVTQRWFPVHTGNTKRQSEYEIEKMTDREFSACVR
jgi:hypothetical protein